MTTKEQIENIDTEIKELEDRMEVRSTMQQTDRELLKTLRIKQMNLCRQRLAEVEEEKAST